MKKRAIGLLLLLLPQAQVQTQARAIHASLDPVKDEPAITAEDRQHWAFTPLAVPEAPKAGSAGGQPLDLDRFILAKLEAAGLALSPPADPATLLRRLTLDLTGLPPTPEAVRDFASKPANESYEAYVDSLLASPRYGEAQAQPWLDLARFAETDGFEHDIERKHAWKYRDWVIAAFNRDLPFDEFVRQQIAGDEIEAADPIATGFLVAGPDMPDINNQDERRHFVLNDITSTVGSAFLGLTMGCAQCHDHPYDPVSQADFYRLRAFFDSIPPFAINKQIGPAMRRTEGAAPASHVYVRGDFQRAGPEVTPAFPRIANGQGKGAGNQRLVLAKWLTQPDNALFVRVAANRLWQQHFDRGLAAEPSDLGHQGKAPTHPELLDWLAAELPRQGWSLKKMHKMIVMSATYRQGPQQASSGAAATLYAGFPRRRLTGEVLRDAILFSSGLLNPKAGGPSVKLPLPAEVQATIPKQHREITADTAEHDRRSIYTFSRRNVRHPLFDLFDRPDALMSCGRRNESTTAPQALLLFNSEFSHRAAQAMAAKILEHAETAPGKWVTEAIWRTLSRPPTDEELQWGTAFLQKQAALAPALNEAFADYCLALLNSNAFIWVD